MPTTRHNPVFASNFPHSFESLTPALEQVFAQLYRRHDIPLYEALTPGEKELFGRYKLRREAADETND